MHSDVSALIMTEPCVSKETFVFSNAYGCCPWCVHYLVLQVYFRRRFIQAAHCPFPNRFSTWLGLCSVSGPTHTALPLSRDAQLTWQGAGCSFALTGGIDEEHDMSIVHPFLLRRLRSTSFWSLEMFWPAICFLYNVIYFLTLYCFLCLFYRNS